MKRYVSSHYIFIDLTDDQDVISQDPLTRGSMFVPIVAGSDKTTVSVGTGSQEYHPVYASLGNITNTARRAHGNGVVPVAFLPIPKSESIYYLGPIAVTEGWTAFKRASASESGQNSRYFVANFTTVVLRWSSRHSSLI